MEIVHVLNTNNATTVDSFQILVYTFRNIIFLIHLTEHFYIIDGRRSNAENTSNPRHVSMFFNNKQNFSQKLINLPLTLDGSRIIVDNEKLSWDK